MVDRHYGDVPDDPNIPDDPRRRKEIPDRRAWAVDYGFEEPDEVIDDLEFEPETEATVEQPERPERLWQTIAEETGEIRIYRSFTAAKRDLGVLPGSEIHHLVEQSQAKRSGFSVERINTTDNLTRIPTDIHREVSAWFSRKPLGQDATRRDQLNGMSWQDQYEYGCDVLDLVMGADDDDD